MLKTTLLPVVCLALASSAHSQVSSIQPLPAVFDYGRAQGAWLHPGSSQEGIASGKLTDAAGKLRYRLEMVVSPIEPNQRHGRVQGVLLEASDSADIAAGGTAGIVPGPTQQMLLVDGIWLPMGIRSGFFSAHVLQVTDPLPFVYPMGVIEGEFELDRLGGSVTIDLSERRLARALANLGLHPVMQVYAADVAGGSGQEADEFMGADMSNPSITIIACPAEPEMVLISVTFEGQMLQFKVPATSFYTKQALHLADTAGAPAADLDTTSETAGAGGASSATFSATRRGVFAAVWYLDA